MVYMVGLWFRWRFKLFSLLSQADLDPAPTRFPLLFNKINFQLEVGEQKNQNQIILEKIFKVYNVRDCTTDKKIGTGWYGD